MIRVFLGVPGSYGNTRKNQWASWAKWWKRGGRARGPPSPNRIGLGGRPPFPPFPPSPSFSSSPFLFLLLVGVGKGSPTPTRRRTPPLSLARPIGSRPPPCSFIYGGRGAPKNTLDIRYFSRVRCPPPPYYTSIIPLRSLGEALRRWNIIIVTTPSC